MRDNRVTFPLGVAVALVTAMLAAACAADDPIGAFDESACSLEPATAAGVASTSEADDHGDDADEADDHGDDADEADDHGDDADEADDHSDEPLVADYVVDMDMLEFGYSCNLPAIEAGTVIEFRMVNVGAVEHEAVFGDLAAQDEAEAQMAASSGDEDAHGDDDHGTPTLVLAPGESGTIVVMFDEPGDMIIGCHVPGHWDAGMRSDYQVVA
jgi:uncharacterized cupredoxin-like copper-binding protein